MHATCLTLAPVSQQGWTYSLPIRLCLAEKPLCLGRAAKLAIPHDATSVSRNHCEVWLPTPERLHLLPHKTIFVQRLGEEKAQPCQKGVVIWLELGDKFFLARNNGQLLFGFYLEKTEKPREKRSANATPNEEGLAKKPCTEVKEVASRSFLATQHLVFWERRHMRQAMARAKEAGAVIEDGLTAQTTYVVAGKDTSLADVAMRLQQPKDQMHWPPGVCFVTPDFITSCIAERKLLPPDRYLIPIRQHFKESHKQIDSRDCTDPDAGAEKPNSHNASVEIPGGVVSGAAEIVPEPDPGQVTGGHSGIPWGAGDCWVEPWDRESALETIRLLDRRWHRQDQQESASMSSPTKSAPGYMEDLSDSEQEGLLRQRDPSTKCSHIACSASDGCIVEQLSLLKSQYDRSGIDQYRRRAAEKGLRTIAQHSKALKSSADVDEMELGKETAAKVKEIITNGSLARNRAFLSDPRAQTIYMFSRVWGAAGKTAVKWHAEGCRSLDDIGKRVDLTEQQVAGLKHFDDMQVRIPRTEGLEILAMVRSTALKLFGWSLGAPDAPHIRAMGSLLRGKNGTTDVDILVVPPKAEMRDSADLMMLLLTELRRVGFVTDDMNPLRVRLPREHSCTFLGFCKLPDGRHVRRLDVKIYPRWTMPFAVNYFTGSGIFNRALRYWANTALPAVEAARRHSFDSSGFKLSDTSLVPRKVSGYGKDRRQVETAPPLDTVHCETDIFKTLGLSYVPPHMRFFHNFQ